ncbi:MULTISPECIES: glycosyltransferase [Bacteria]|uniref:glycosyltransferase n=1 Tax=Bacteria TaxID=2 RepID=UPI0018674DA8|nr:glycosyltransferase [Vibrio litoralis]
MLTIAIATLSRNLNPTMDKVKELAKIFDSVNFFIVSQGESINEKQVHDNVTILKSTTIGLSKSRNIAIDHVSDGFLWFQDDDISLNYSVIDDMCLELLKVNSDVFFVRIGSLEDTSRHYKSYKHYNSFFNYFNFLKVSSIEIVVKVSFIKSNCIYFDEGFGLGTDLPCCEENKFILDCLKNDCAIYYSSLTTCYHTTLLETRNIDYKKNLFAKGCFLRCLPLFVAIPIMLRWAFIIPSSFGFFSNLMLLLKGFKFK